MSGTIVNAKTPADSVRLEVFGGSRAVTIPSELLLAIDDVLKALASEDENFDLHSVEDDETGWQGWEASLGHFFALGTTPWAAINALAGKLQWDGRQINGKVTV